jgi:hypothetical protein
VANAAQAREETLEFFVGKGAGSVSRRHLLVR